MEENPGGLREGKRQDGLSGELRANQTMPDAKLREDSRERIVQLSGTHLAEMLSGEHMKDQGRLGKPCKDQGI